MVGMDRNGGIYVIKRRNREYLWMGSILMKNILVVDTKWPCCAVFCAKRRLKSLKPLFCLVIDCCGPLNLLPLFGLFPPTDNNSLCTLTLSKTIFIFSNQHDSANRSTTADLYNVHKCWLLFCQPVKYKDRFNMSNYTVKYESVISKQNIAHFSKAQLTRSTSPHDNSDVILTFPSLFTYFQI